jgi:hypothetical protein
MFESWSAAEWNEAMLLRRDRILELLGVDLSARVKDFAQERHRVAREESEEPLLEEIEKTRRIPDGAPDA